MPDFPVNPNKWKALQERMVNLGIREEDLEEQFVRSCGPGGQKVNKVSTCVVLTHRPSGLSVHCQEERSQGLNRFLARRRLADKIEEKVQGEASRKRQTIEKICWQKRKRSKLAKEKVLQAKRHRAEIKEGRKPVGEGE